MLFRESQFNSCGVDDALDDDDMDVDVDLISGVISLGDMVVVVV